MGLSSLVHLRLRADLILLYKILRGKVNLFIEEFSKTPAKINLRDAFVATTKLVTAKGGASKLSRDDLNDTDM